MDEFRLSYEEYLYYFGDRKTMGDNFKIDNSFDSFDCPLSERELQDVMTAIVKVNEV